MTVRGEWSQLANLQIVQWAGAHAEHVLRESEMASLPSVGVLQGGALISHSGGTGQRGMRFLSVPTPHLSTWLTE